MDPTRLSEEEQFQLIIERSLLDRGERHLTNQSTSTTASAPRKRPRSADDESSAPTSSKRNASSSSSSRLRQSDGVQQFERSPKNRAKGAVPDVEEWNEGLTRHRRGAVRITCTPGREDAPNTVKLSDICKPRALRSGFMSSMYIDDDYLAEHFLPNRELQRSVPLYVSRDLKHDPILHIAAKRVGVMLNDKGQFSKRDGKKLAAELYELHQQIRGPNWHASYPYARGSVHSKVMILKYTNFLLVLITSCNFLQCDFEFSDNHWFIMSFPLLPQPAIDNSQITPFERILLRHTNELDCPKEFIDDIFGKYDYSQTVNRIHLVVSEPDVSHDPELYGILRLGELARELLPPAVVEKKEVNLEICTASLGAFQLDWVKQVSWLLSGRPLESLLERIKKEKVDKLKIPEWTVVYAAKETVKKCSEDVQRIAAEMGCRLSGKAWTLTHPSIKAMFHDYVSKDPGRMFHQKLLLWFPTTSSSSRPAKTGSSSSATSCVSSFSSTSSSASPPLLLYFGSHNFSRNAWGQVSLSEKRHKLQLQDINNYELGVVMKGEQLEEMVEPGNGWESVVTYERPARRYGEEDSPWNSPLWVQNK